MKDVSSDKTVGVSARRHLQCIRMAMPTHTCVTRGVRPVWGNAQNRNVLVRAGKEIKCEIPLVTTSETGPVQTEMRVKDALCGVEESMYRKGPGVIR